MSLGVYVGSHQASRRYENQFFRQFASTLSGQFEDEGWEGALLGHPESKDNKFFQPDALVLTSRGVVIIDFKNFDKTTVRLPPQGSFHSDEWRSVSAGRATVVKGGTSSNPFAQLQKQRSWMQQITASLGVDVPIHTCVLFQGDVQIQGEVPGRFAAYFSIATGFDYTRVLADSINLRGSSRPLDVGRLVDRFDVKQYRDYTPVTREQMATLDSMAEVMQRRHQAERAASMANAKLGEAERLLIELGQRGESLVAAQQDLEKARGAAEKLKADAEQLARTFDAKRHELELARELTRQRDSEAIIERSRRSRAAMGLAAFIGATALVLAGVVIWIQGLQAESESVREDQLAGRTCIPVRDVASFIGSEDVCVTFTVRHVGESERYVFIQEQAFGDFTALVVDKSVYTAEEAESQFDNRLVEVRGDVSEYEGTAQIKVFDSSQISLPDQDK